MLTVDPRFLNRNILHFINCCTIKMIQQKKTLTSDKKYWLFYYVKDGVTSNLYSLYNYDIEQDFLGYPVIKQITRKIIEAYVDLFNLSHDPNYLEVLEYTNKSRSLKNLEKKYADHLYYKYFSILSKIKMAIELYGGNQDWFDRLSDNAKEFNSYVHPNIFLDTNYDINSKIMSLQQLLSLNIDLLIFAFEIFRPSYRDISPLNLGCNPCNYEYNCTYCYNCWKHYTKTIIASRKQLFYYSTFNNNMAFVNQ